MYGTMPYISRKDLIEASQADSLTIMVRTSASLAARPIPLHALPVQRLPAPLETRFPRPGPDISTLRSTGHL
jgi:hypothetical protein